jgi:hypothetical protein
MEKIWRKANLDKKSLDYYDKIHLESHWPEIIDNLQEWLGDTCCYIFFLEKHLKLNTEDERF